MTTFTFDDLISWSEKLPLWQRDALRRVLAGSLTDADISELVEMAKANQGFPMPGAPTPNPATNARAPSSSASPLSIALLSVRDITYVNALASGPITFAPEGLTVIYGDNAAGKSGITRILKKAGHAREPGGLIRPSVFEPDPNKPASAVIDFRLGTTDCSFTWVDGLPTNGELARVNVFDANCAAVQVEGDNRLAYTPEILQVFQDLAEACRAVSTRLKSQIDALESARSPQLTSIFLRPQTAAGILFANLSMTAKTADIDALCDVSNDESERHKALARALQQNPDRQADLLETQARHLSEVEGLVRSAQSLLCDSALQNFEQRINDAAATAEAARAARDSFAKHSDLTGIGTEAWKQLWESARRYSDTLAYPREPFPVTRENALCLLCQQPLSRFAAHRLTEFEKFIQDDVQQRADKAHSELHSVLTRLQALKIPASGTQLRRTGLRGTPVGQSLRAFSTLAKLRCRYILRKARGFVSGSVPDLPQPPDLGPVQAAVKEEINRIRAAARADERSKMQSEFAELDDRLKLAPLKDVLKEEIVRLVCCALLDSARRDCDTTGITRKGGEAAQIVVTSRLRSDFAANLSRLGFTAAPVEVKLGLGTVGQHPYHLSLIAREDVRPSEVLSEGEKTCVALAGFLAEIQTTNNNGSSIVLDDPVSSLDHHYRVRVARLLVDVAKERQVVVLTHDIVFLLMITKYARKAGVPVTERSLRRGAPRHGILEEGPPWIAMSVKGRIGVLRKELQAAEAILRSGDRPAYEQKAEWIYDRLRQSWERAIEELLLNQVVVRFGDGVSTQRLKALTDISEADVQTVDTEMTYCSGFVHDESFAVNSGTPDPPVIAADIKRLEDWVTALRKRGRN